MQPSSEELHAGEGDPVQDWVQGGVWQEIQKGASTSVSFPPSSSTSTCTSTRPSTGSSRRMRYKKVSPVKVSEHQPARSKILFGCWSPYYQYLSLLKIKITRVKPQVTFITSGVSRWTLPSQNWPRMLSGTWDSFDNQFKSTWGVIMKKTHPYGFN